MDESPRDSANEPYKSDPFYRELAALYENPEVFFDTSKPLLPRFRVRSFALPDAPVIVTTEISEDLVLALRESAFSMLRGVPGIEEAILAEYQTDSWDHARQKILEDESYRTGEHAMYWFFIRCYPRLTLHIFDIACRIAVAHTLRRSIHETPEQRRTTEADIKKGLAALLADLRKDIHGMLGTKTRGGSTSKIRDDLRRSLHLEYDNLHTLAKVIKNNVIVCEKPLQRAVTA